MADWEARTMNPRWQLGVAISLAASLAFAALASSPVTGQQAPTAPGVFIYEDTESDMLSGSKAAADNLGLSYDTSTDPCEIANVSDPADYRLMVVENSVKYFDTACSGSLYDALSAYAQKGGSLVLHSWEIAVCLENASLEADCDEQAARDLLAALGIEHVETVEEPRTLKTAVTTSACNAGPHPLIPAGMDIIEPQRNAFLHGGIYVTGLSVPCLIESEDAWPAVTMSPNGAYIGVFAEDYRGSQGTMLPGPQDIVKVYENAMTIESI